MLILRNAYAKQCWCIAMLMLSKSDAKQSVQAMLILSNFNSKQC